MHLHLNLYCECCQNKVAERGVDTDVILIKTRGAARRRYVVSAIITIHCDNCGHVGAPLPSVLSVQEVREARANGTLHVEEGHLRG